MNAQIRLEQTSYCQKFNACRIEKNHFSSPMNQTIFTQHQMQDNMNHDKSNQNPIRTKEKAISIYIDEQSTETPKLKNTKNQKLRVQSVFSKNQNNEETQRNNKHIQIQFQSQEEEDFTELWNQIASNKSVGENVLKQNKQIQNVRMLNKSKEKLGSKNMMEVIQCSSQESACQLTQAQMQEWMKCCNVQKQNIKPNIFDQNEGNETSQASQKTQKYEDIIQVAQIDLSNQAKKQIKVEEKQQQAFVIMDSLPSQVWKIQKKQLKKQRNSRHENFQQLQTFRGEKKQVEIFLTQLNTQFYNIYPNYNIKLIHKMLYEDSRDASEVEQKLKPLRQINWQIKQQKKPEIKQLISKRSCQMTLLQHGADFLIFDHLKFIIEPVRDLSHIYFGIKARGNFAALNLSGSSQTLQVNQATENKVKLKQYLYLPSNGQCLLETIYPEDGSEFSQVNIKKFSVHLSLTNQKIAQCERFIFNEQKDKRQVTEVKFYDPFEQACTHYAGIIQSKISNFSDQWYCDTIIYIPKRKQYSNKVNSKFWDRFKIQLRLSENGAIVAQLGIFDAQSSVTNCILYSQNKMSHFMMGTMLQRTQEIDYIMRIAGLSPLMGFVTALSRKIFVISS